MDVSLHQFVLQRVRAHRDSGKSLRKLAKAAGVETSWLYTFTRGEIPNPGIVQIEKLAAHFTADPLPDDEGSQERAG